MVDAPIPHSDALKRTIKYITPELHTPVFSASLQRQTHIPDAA